MFGCFYPSRSHRLWLCLAHGIIVCFLAHQKMKWQALTEKLWGSAWAFQVSPKLQLYTKSFQSTVEMNVNNYRRKKQKTHKSSAKLSRISKKSELPNGWVDVVTNILLWPPDEDSNRTEMGTVRHTLDVALPPSFPNGVFPETTLQCSNWVFRACGLGRGTCGVGEGGVGGRRKDVS